MQHQLITTLNLISIWLIWELRQHGLSILQISIQLKIGKASVHEWCKRFDPERKYNHSHKKRNHKQINDIVQTYIKLKSLQNLQTYFC